ncbi:MAG: large protein [Chitinophagaceae bacterium]|nr:large protein [Chitinophagaceae bacterium]
MKKVLRYLVLGFAVSSLNILVAMAQPTFDFVRSIGGANNDYGTSIAVLDSNAGSNVNLIYATGVIHGSAINFNPAGTAKPLSSQLSPNGDLYIAKYGSTGFLTASGTNAAFRVGSNADNDVSTKIYVDASKNIYVVGTCTANSFFAKDNLSGKLVGSQGSAFIIKYDKDYVIQWGISFGPTLVTDGAQVRGISVDNSGNVYVTGVFQGTGINFNPGSTIGSSPDPGPFTPVNLTSNGSYDAFVAKYNSGGKCLWALSAGGSVSDEGYGVGNDASGNVYVTGIFRGQNIDFDPSASTANLSETGGGSTSGDIFVAKYSSAGAYVNSFNMGNALFEGATAIAVDASGDFAISGYFAKDALAIDFDPDPVGTANAIAVGSSGTDLFVAKYSSALAYQWHKTVGSAGNEKATHIKLSGSNLFVTGSYENTPTDFGNSNVLTSAGGTDAFMAGYTFSTGNCLFASSIGGAGNEEGSGIDFVNNKLYVTGYNNGNGDYDPGAGTSTAFTANGGQDIFFAQYTYASCTLPSISTGPSDLTRCTGTSANFSVTATGATSYQWKKGGVNVSTGTGGTTASYSISPVAAGDAGSYTVDVTNTCGTVTSSAATLTVSTPVTANAGTAQNICNATIASLSGSNPSPGTGAWTVFSGSGTVTTPSSATSGVTGLTVGSSSTFTWTITNGACITSSNVTVTVSSPATSNAGPDQALCNVTNASMASTGAGLWTTVSGSGVAANPSSNTTNVHSLTIGGTTTMRWTVTNGSCTATSDMIITVSAAGSANAGSDQPLCNVTSSTLAAAGSGTWTTTSGSGVATNPTNPNSAVTGLTVGATTVLTWTVTAGACSGTDQVSLIVSAPATGSAGTNQNLCGVTSSTLSATGTGTWAKTSGTGTVTTPSDPNSAVTGLTIGASSVFEWTVTNGACSNTTSTTIASNAPVTINTQPAAFSNLCTGNAFNLNVIATGSGTLTYQWKLGSSNAGGASTSSTYSIASIVFGDAGNYTVDVTNSCGTVTSNIAQLTIQNLIINTQPVGQTVCPGANVTFNVVASGPSVSYQWKKDNVDLLTQTSSSLNLNGVSATDAASYTVLVSGCSNSILSDAAVLALSVCTGTEDETSGDRFRLYPNPATTSVHLSGFAQDPIQSIMIVDVNGDVVYQEKDMSASSHDVSVAAFTQGLYHVILFTASGNKWVEKIEVAK